MRKTIWAFSCVVICLFVIGCDKMGPSRKVQAAYKAGDYNTAMELGRPLAESGDSVSQYLVGRMYCLGLGVAESPAEAKRWWQKAAEQGHVEAQYWLAVLYSAEHGEKGVPAEAMNWYRKAAEQGHEEAQNSLCAIYFEGGYPKEDLPEALKWVRKVIERGPGLGYGQAQFHLGLAYERGEGVEKDPAQALQWIKKAAEETGFIEAKLDLGRRYLKGVGVQKDPAAVVRLFKEAADDGDMDAQYELGSMYAEGNWVFKKDDVEAYRWSYLAADRGHEKAAKLRDKIKGRLTTEQIEKAQKWAARFMSLLDLQQKPDF